MSFETISTPEKEEKVPSITSEEWLEHSGADPSDEEFQKWLQKKGIKFDDNGVAKMELDGEVVATKKDDFGTIIEEDKEDIA